MGVVYMAYNIEAKVISSPRDGEIENGSKGVQPIFLLDNVRPIPSGGAG